ncbi:MULTISPECIES: PPE family protein [unclassified Mycobacterium]|uniref:PPE family protein n=1 Tax=unclassified Mycobacterium TaxID=2642494 RepID=UPI00274278BE|nr:MULTISPECIES: PPE family protein [unclassified Mycobacterium]MDP7707291.1 PPE family protein [Mycobacterium sp. TY815]MDP7723893.1 PPE family protein [Mycobacterium sp. TY814]
MILDFAWLPPEINSLRMFAGSGSASLHGAAAAWEGLASDLSASASSFNAVIAGLTGGPWAGPASASMAAAALPYVDWLGTAGAQAAAAAAQARAAATAFEGALTATVHPAVVEANRTSLLTLIATNFLGLNTPAIFANEFDYVEMWAQDVAAMLGYHGGATAVAESLTPFSVPPLDLAGMAANIGTQVTGFATTASAAVSPMLESAVAAGSGLAVGVQSAAAAFPVQSAMSFIQAGAMPASMLIGPLMQAGQSATSTAGLAGATAAADLADVPKFVGDIAPAAKGLGGAALGAGMAGDLGKAHLVGAMSVPPSWQGSVPKGMASSAMSGLGAAMPNPAAMAGAAGGGMPMMPMPMGMGGGAGAGMPGGMMGRGGASPHVVQNRPSVIPRTGVG